MMRVVKWLLALVLGVACTAGAGELEKIVLDYDTGVDAALQGKVEGLDARLRERFGMSEAQTAVGVMDLKTGRLALVRGDREEYAASVAKIGILLAYFEAHPGAGEKIDPAVERELGEMAKVSSNEMAAKYSRELGLKEIQRVLSEKYGFYDAKRGGGLWVGKHYGKGAERYGSPVGDNSHAATVRQVMRFFVMLEQGKLVSPAASREMRKIFEAPSLKHDDIKFVKGLAGRDVQVIRKWGTWQDWRHDAAVVTGGGRHYVVVGLTRHAKGDEYLEELVRGVDDLMRE
jgi:beta-lactamase class A